MNNKVALIILDGLGISNLKKGNAVKMANMSNFNEYKRRFLYTELNASGTDVGLLDGLMGNSEVGHLNIGAGRVVNQESKIISDAIANKTFYNNKQLIKAFSKCKKKMHLFFLLSDSGVHSSFSHILATLDIARYFNKKVLLHIITDGRDSSVNASLEYLKKLSEHIVAMPNIKIASISGRFFAMDREMNWDRTKAYYDMLVYSKSELINNKKSLDSVEYIKSNHKKGITDEFIKPYIMDSDYTISNNDTLLFLNFRADRMRQVVQSFQGLKTFKAFKTIKLKLEIFTMTIYNKNFKHAKAIFKSPVIKNTLGEFISKNKKTQLRVTESTKYPHLTYFFNGRREKKFKNEERVLIETKKVENFDLYPQMRAKEIFFNIRKNTNSKKFDFVLANFSNPDMVGHTGNIKATVDALETTDYYLGKMVNHLLKLNYKILITSDHGNSEQMLNKDGSICTTHTKNKVPFILIDKNLIKTVKLRKDAKLSDIAPTVLRLYNLSKPCEFDGEDIISE